MIDKFKLYDTTRISVFLAAISAATERVNDLSVRLTTLAGISGTAALQIARLSNAAQTMTTGQTLATRCEYKCGAPTTPPSTVSSLWEKAWKGCFLGAAAIGAAALWSAAAKRLWAIITAPIAMSGASVIGRVVTALWGAVSASKGLAAVAETAGELIAAVAARVVSFPIAPIAGAARLGGAAYLTWGSWGAVVQAIRRPGTAVSHGAIGIMHKLMTALEGGEPEGSSTEDVGSAGDVGISRRKRGRLYSIAPSIFDSVAASVSRIPHAIVALNQPRLCSGFQRGPLIVGKAAAIAMLSAPMLAAPAMASVRSGQREADIARVPSIVINSTPTIVINASQPSDIEQQIMEALRRHRAALYEQLCCELQRRQRTEF